MSSKFDLFKKQKTSPKKVGLRSIGVLCSGGDAPGMNAALRAVVRAGIYFGLEVYGIQKGYTGLLEGSFTKMTLRSVANIIQRGGTVIKTDRCQAFLQKNARAEAVHLLRRKKIDGLVVIGGEGSFSGAHLMGTENRYPVVGIPGTIDNDVFGSEYTIGFDTAVNTALDAIDKIRDTASAHDRVFLVEVMGRTSAEIAIRVGVSGGAETILIPGRVQNTDRSTPTAREMESLDKLILSLKRSASQGKMSSIVVVAEGEAEGIAYRYHHELKTRAAIDSRVAILGHVQRGGSPSALDRYMASIMGAEAVQCLREGKSGVAIGVVSGKIKRIPFTKIIGRHKTPDTAMLRLAEILAS